MNKKPKSAWNNTEELDIIITPIQIDGFSWFTAGLTNETINENINILKSQSQSVPDILEVGETYKGVVVESPSATTPDRSIKARRISMSINITRA
jgi:hypothetical protein